MIQGLPTIPTAVSGRYSKLDHTRASSTPEPLHAQRTAIVILSSDERELYTFFFLLFIHHSDCYNFPVHLTARLTELHRSARCLSTKPWSRVSTLLPTVTYLGYIQLYYRRAMIRVYCSTALNTHTQIFSKYIRASSK